MMPLRKVLLIVIGLFPCLFFLQCVIGAEGGPCQATADCDGQKVCFGGVCLDPKSEAVRLAELPLVPDKAPPRDRVVVAPPGQERRVGLSAGGTHMASAGYRLLGSISAGVGQTQEMSSPNFQLKAGLITGTTP